MTPEVDADAVPVTRRRRRRVLRASILALAVLLAFPTASLLRAVTAPGPDPVSAKVAEWARGHHLGFVITAAEELAYRLNPPRVGGTPDPGLLQPDPPGPVPTATAPTTPGASAPDASSPPAYRAVTRPAMATIVAPALTGEGPFRPVVMTTQGPAAQIGYLRPDAQHTSYVAAVLVLDQHLVRFVQHPGSTEPGPVASWSQSDRIPQTQRTGLVATFNGGFKFADARGGFYLAGHTGATLTTGAASAVITRDGRLDVGAWDRQVAMTSAVVSVRQNLRLLIDHGAVVPSVAANLQSTWGATVAGADFVWRSGLGVDASGNVIEVVGLALSAPSLAAVLLHAGAVRAMELDINPLWTSTMWYSATADGQAVPHKVVPFQQPADRYFTQTSRDFFAAYLR